MRSTAVRPVLRQLASSSWYATPHRLTATATSAVASSSAVRLDSVGGSSLRSISTSRSLSAEASPSASASPSLAPSPTPTPTQPPPKRPTATAHRPSTTRSPTTPEEPNVFKNDSSPCVLLTDRAIAHLSKIAAKEPADMQNGRIALRIAVEPGGCHGYQYKMEIERAEDGAERVGEEDDFHFQAAPAEKTPDITPIPLIIDSISLTLLRGSTIDYVTELIGSQFAIKDNPQAKGAGCGCGVSWEPIV